MSVPSLDLFISGVRAILVKAAAGKGYQDEGDPNPGGDLLKFTKKHFDGHALGEVVYKAVRYRTKGDPADLVKIAAWAYLEWTNSLAAGSMQPVLLTAPPLTHAGLRAILDGINEEAMIALDARPGVAKADPVRLAGLVVEEAGEAMKAALDLTRGAALARDESANSLAKELMQTAAMASIALIVLKSQGVVR